MAKLIITRSSEYINRVRGIRIFINGNEMGKISNGQTRETELPAGNYSLKAKVDWCGSNEFHFQVADNETKEVTLTSFGYSWYFIPISFVITSVVAILQFVLKIDEAAFLAMPVLLVLGYYFTIGRNKYLVIKEKGKSNLPLNVPITTKST